MVSFEKDGIYRNIIRPAQTPKVSNETAVSFWSCRHEKPGSRKCLSSKECYFLFVVTLGWSVINSLDCWRENSIYFQWKINRQLLSSSLLYLVCIYKIVLCVCVFYRMVFRTTTPTFLLLRPTHERTDMIVDEMFRFVITFLFTYRYHFLESL